MFLYKNKIVVTGGTGRFGRALRKIKTKKNISFPTKGELNILDVNSIKNSEIIFLEGYLWDEGDPKSAFDKAIKNSNKVAMSLSDLFCVERHKPHFLELVKKN